MHIGESHWEAQSSIHWWWTRPTGNLFGFLWPRSSFSGSDVDAYSKGQSSRQGSVTSGALRSVDDSNSIGYTFERTTGSEVVAVTQPPKRIEVSCEASTSPEPHATQESPGAQTIDSLKEEALRDNRQSKRRQTKTQAKTSRRCHWVSRSCKILNDRGVLWRHGFDADLRVRTSWPQREYLQILLPDL